MRRPSGLSVLLVAALSHIVLGGIDPSCEAASKELSKCLLAKLPPSDCIASSSADVKTCLTAEYQALTQAFRTAVDNLNNSCATALQQDLASAESAEALLASGRLATFFGLLIKLLGEAASGLPPDFLINAHLESLGSADTCQSISGQHYCWIAPKSIPSSKAGVCLPSECSLSDVPILLNPLLQHVSNGTAPPLTLDHIVGQCGYYRFGATPMTYVMVVVSVLLVALVLAATAFDWWLLEEKQKKREAAAPEGYSQLEAEDEDLGEDGLEDGSKDRGGADASLLETQEAEKPPTLAYEMLHSFSLYKNLPSLLAPARPGDFNTLDGVRTFSMTWVVLGHLFLWPTEYVGYSNEQDILPPNGLMATYSGQALLAGEFAVDTFFTLGAFVAAFFLTQHLIRQLSPPAGSERKALGYSWVPMLYVHRWLRLTPAYFFVLLFYWHVMRLMDSGPFWGLLNQDYGYCEKHWQWNLLYVNVLVPWDSMEICYAVSWYMSVDFLLFLLLPFVALVFAYNRIAGYVVPATLWLASTIYSWNLAYRKDISQFGLSPGPYQLDYYFKPWTRAPAVIIGWLFAFLWCDLLSLGVIRPASSSAAGGRRPGRAPWVVWVAFAFAFFLLGSVVYGAQPFLANPGEEPVSLDHAYLALSRSAWCVGLCTVLFLAFLGYGRPIIALLDNQVMAVLSRLTFLAYLIHPAVLSFLFADQQQPPHYSVMWIITQFLGVLAVVFLLSAIVHLLVEKPFANLERLLLRGGGGGDGSRKRRKDR